MLVTPLVSYPLKILQAFLYLKGKDNVKAFAYAILAIVCVQVAIASYLVAYFYRTGSFLVEHLREETDNGRTFRQKTFMFVILASVALNFLRHHLVDTVEVLNTTNW